MAIEDKNPERRNLVLLSAAIIAFYVGECVLQKHGEITLPFFKLTFTNPNGLAVIVWLMLLWFMWRYYVSAHQKTEQNVYRELNKQKYGLWLFSASLRKRLRLKDDIGTDRLIYWHRDHESSNTEGKNKLVIKYLPKDSQGPDVQNFESLGQDVSPEIDVSDSWHTKRIYYFSRFIALFKKPYQSEYYAPFVIFYIAVGFGVVNYFSGPDLPSATSQEVRPVPVEPYEQLTNDVISYLNKLMLDVYSKGKDDARSEILRALGFQSNSELPPVPKIDSGSNHAQDTTPSGE